MQTTLFLSLLILSLSIQAAPAPSQPPESLNIGILDFPPLYSCNDGALKGLYTTLLKRVTAKAGFKHTLRCYPPKRLYTFLASGDVDFFMGLDTTNEYKNRVLSSEAAIKYIELRLYALPQKTLPTSKDHWPGNRFVIQNGYNYGELIIYLENLERQGEIVLHRSAEHSNALKMLYSDRADYLLGYKTTIDSVSKELNAPELISQEIFKLNLHFIISKKTPAAAEVLQRIEAAYRAMEDH